MYKSVKTSPAFKLLAVVLAVVLLFLSFRAFAAEYKIDKEHSRVGFTIKHLMITNIHGQFNDFSGTFTFDPAKLTLLNPNITVQTASIDTAVAKRDEHLKSADFFDVAKYPTMTFTNTSIKKAGKDRNKFSITGELTLHGVTRKETFDLVYTGTKKAKTGENRAGFRMTGMINRLDYGMNWGAPIEGDVMINKEVNIEIDVSAIEVGTQAAAGK